ncbi:MAG: FAD-dependent oxidoreductase [Candidatus Helarchaeota archaeon]
MNNGNKSVLVIGGGIAGIQAALDLAENGLNVEIVESKPAIGGIMARLDKTFPTNDCAICILAPKLSDCFRHPNIRVHTLSEITKVKRENGGFTVSITKYPRYVKEDECVNCGDCVQKCPVRVDDEFDMYLRKRKAIYMYYMQAVPSVMTIDPNNCLYLTRNVCRICEKMCKREAIDFNQTKKEITLNVGAIILATGFEIFDASALKNLGYKKYRNVITALEFERLISASGPTAGHLERPSDHKPPKKIAFLQCIGSRDINNNPYCSSICCMYATKEAILAHEHDREVQSTIFYIDLRAAGKGFQEYLIRGEKEYNITYVRSKVAEIRQDENENLIIRYENKELSKICEDTFDLVVLAPSMIPQKNSQKLAETLNIKYNNYNFIETSYYSPLNTSEDGIFACGCCRMPMDIPHSVAEASGAAAKAIEYILSKNL